MIAQSQIFSQGQPMSHQAQNQVPVHTQLSHQQHLLQSYKPQMTQAHQLQISQNLGQAQGQGQVTMQILAIAKCSSNNLLDCLT
jgi:hypothetical protein